MTNYTSHICIIKLVSDLLQHCSLQLFQVVILHLHFIFSPFLEHLYVLFQLLYFYRHFYQLFHEQFNILLDLGGPIQSFKIID